VGGIINRYLMQTYKQVMWIVVNRKPPITQEKIKALRPWENRLYTSRPMPPSLSKCKRAAQIPLKCICDTIDAGNFFRVVFNPELDQ